MVAKIDTFEKNERRPDYSFVGPVDIWVTTQDEGIPMLAHARLFGDIWISWSVSARWDRMSKEAQFRYGLETIKRGLLDVWSAIFYWEGHWG